MGHTLAEGGFGKTRFFLGLQDPVARFERHLILLKMNSQIAREPKLQVYQPLLIFLILQRCLH